MGLHQGHVSRGGFSLIELVLAVALFALITVGLVTTYLEGQESTRVSGNRAQAVLLADEGQAAMRSIRDANFDNLIDGTYGLTFGSSGWELAGSPDLFDIYTRTIEISTIDTNKKNIAITITWDQNTQREGSIQVTSILTNWGYTESGGCSWDAAAEETILDLSGNDNVKGIAVSGNYVYLLRNNPDLTVIDISNPASPSVESTLSLSGNPQDIYVESDYVYIASNANSQELQIVDVSNPSAPSLAGSYNRSGNQNAKGVFVVGTTAYLVSAGNTEFYAIDVSSPSSPSSIGSLNFSDDLLDVVVSGNYAYTGSEDNSPEVKVIDISTPSSPSEVGTLNLSGSTDAEVVAISGSTLYVGQGSDLHSIDVSTPSSPSLLDTYDAGDTISDIGMTSLCSGTRIVLATDHLTSQFQLIDTTTPSSLALLDSVELTEGGNLRSIAYDETNDRVYAGGTDNSQEFTIITSN